MAILLKHHLLIIFVLIQPHLEVQEVHSQNIKRSRGNRNRKRNKATKIIVIKRHLEIGLGFSTRGGFEHGDPFTSFLFLNCCHTKLNWANLTCNSVILGVFSTV